jgi:phytoene desaturase
VTGRRLRVAVVGAGLGGLSAACHLAGAGHQVVVLERSELPGGRAGLLERSGFRLDTGPSVLTMAGILAGTFAAAGTSMADQLTLVRVDPAYRACFAAGGDPVGGGVIHVRHGREAMCEEIRSTCGPADAAAFARFSDWLGALYRLEMGSFIDRNYDSALDLLRRPAPLVALARMGGLRRLSAVVAERFADPRLRKLFSFQAMYAGLAPSQALALYAVITYMDCVEGVWFPLGGMSSVARGLAAAATAAGAEIRYQSPATDIARRGGRKGPVSGVRLSSGELVGADVVVANPDLPVVYRELLGKMRAPLVARHGRYSPSCVVWVAGIAAPSGGNHGSPSGGNHGSPSGGNHGSPSGGRVPEHPPSSTPALAHHNLHFSESWEGAFHELVVGGRRMSDPSILVSVPSVSDPSLAPPGGRTLLALEPAPNLDGRVDWRSERAAARSGLAERVRALGYLGGGTVAVECFADPLDWQAGGMERGTPFALAHRFFQSGPFRPDNVDSRVPGLVLVGSGTRPGVGIPMVLISGRLAAERVEQMAVGSR